MKFIQIFVVLLFVVFLTGCTNVFKENEIKLYQEKYSCSNLCDNNTIINNYISDKFNLSSNNYVLICGECNLNQGKNIKALIKKNETLLSLNYVQLCSLGFCNDSITIAMINDSYDPSYNNIKNNYCSKLKSIKYGKEKGTFACYNESINNSSKVRESCFNGDFEKERNGWKIFAVKQKSNRCESTAEIGDFTVFNWVR